MLVLISRPNEFIDAHFAPDKAVGVKGAKRRGLTRETLILAGLSGIVHAAMNSWAADYQPFE